MIVTIIGISFLFLIFLGMAWAKNEEEKKWNNGMCPKCEKGFFKSFDIDSSGAVGYKCTNCPNITWQSYNTRRQ